MVRNVAAKKVQCDEIWSFCYAKARNVKTAKAAPDGAGDVCELVYRGRGELHDILLPERADFDQILGVLRAVPVVPSPAVCDAAQRARGAPPVDHLRRCDFGKLRLAQQKVKAPSDSV